ncbi:hypothetical protein P389DRAFT_175389 [Cystobasidium minutum MCA 4210]|uniref:uncharacterized protein n=1 Tax=Cystobasidium minutum MCA 4210 TaxID=1397322 RepID=UPI0034CFD87F|eukprot:jgi/Rhomi1/175389/fgenesh1_kg.10_\
MGDVSVRSWDDVILPAVARQIRAQQMMEEMQKKKTNNGKSVDGGGDEDEDLLVTEWDSNGQPRKWQRLNSRKKATRTEAEQATPTPVNEVELPDVEQNLLCMQTISDVNNRQDTTQRQRHQPHSQINPSSSSQHLKVQAAQQSATSLGSQSSSLHLSRPSHYTGRKEVWEDPAPQISPTAVRPENNSGGALEGPSTSDRQTGHAEDETVAGNGQISKEQKEHEKREKEEAAGKHSGGCCKCIIM